MCQDLDLTVTAAADSDKERLSWNESSTLRFSGSIFASAICDAIFASEMRNEEDRGPRGR
jgi:hypothetical protein